MLFGDIIPQDVVGECFLNVIEKALPFVPGDGIQILRSLQELHIAGKIAPILLSERVDLPCLLQEKYSRWIKDGYSMPIAQVFGI